MPELPEVETVRKGLEKLVSGASIKSVDVYWDRIISGSIASSEFKQLLTGEKIIGFDRRGKYIIFHFRQWAMVSHLRMEGKYEVEDSSKPLKKHTHVVFHLADGRDLRYLDVRKFGRMTLVPLGEEISMTGIRLLGPEPTEETFDETTFYNNLQTKKRAIKPLLLDQKIVAGLGNIYVDEALFLAKIHPLRIANSLKKDEVSQLHKAIIKVLGDAVEAGGTTIRSYQNALGEAGTFQVNLSVYGKKGIPCIHCGTPIEKIKVAQRGTHFCSKCQRLAADQ
ncbi:DNA-(apurinic or apyrimidinic site) lyase [Carnobacterium alterfunditum]|uniref:Formamidopyrimidine-DNA glycosylase n=1 Tax=Carnobacterium alterfunditum TaxID=28230 RepID=A0A1N6GC25_9LACT|nr:DNA-formamidopyrimidine glycosylase [Carnobacterium alterfunditum]SIO05044.1 DNA-(apurinic or apyrimidinic site) lyase [Carnobacterium alterfunditum]